ncbi:MAG: metalloregulator ArsR/SmtB family transcription factor [Chloroflexota bacterium]
MNTGMTFRAISDPTRRVILDLLRDEGPLRAGDLAAKFGQISRPAVSKHVRVLREAGLLVQQERGRERWYRLEASALEEVQQWVASYENMWQDKLKDLKVLVEGEG